MASLLCQVDHRFLHIRLLLVLCRSSSFQKSQVKGLEQMFICDKSVSTIAKLLLAICLDTVLQCSYMLYCLANDHLWLICLAVNLRQVTTGHVSGVQTLDTVFQCSCMLYCLMWSKWPYVINLLSRQAAPSQLCLDSVFLNSCSIAMQGIVSSEASCAKDLLNFSQS